MKRYLAVVCVLGVVSSMVIWLAASFRSQADAPQATPPSVVINEVGWGGTAAASVDEWIELYNNTAASLDLTGWTLSDGGDIDITLSGSIAPHAHFLLERTNECTVSDIAADQIYTGGLANTGERLELHDDLGTTIDSADGVGGWPAGSGSPGYKSMERIDPSAPDTPGNWASNDGLTRNGLDCNGDPLNGTPKARNSTYLPPSADLRVNKLGPANILPGAFITYTIAVSNAGQLPAQTTWLTDVLPAQVEFEAQTAPYPLSQPVAGTLVWELGTVPTTTAITAITFTLTGRVAGSASGELTNVITAASSTSEASPANNYDRVTTLVGSQPATAKVVIEALYYQTYESGQPDEAVRVMNVSTITADLSGWGLNDGGSSIATFPSGATLAPGHVLWCTHEALAFERQFGFKPDFEVSDTDPSVPAMGGTWPGFADAGDECLLKNKEAETIDALIYKAGNTQTGGWSGPAVEPWTSGSSFAADGQILYRKRDQATGLPVPDTDTAADWAQDPGDQIDGRKALYPGWDLDAFFFTQRITETATLTVAVAPDNLFDTVAGLLAGAQESIRIETYSFRSRELADLLLERISHGVSVSVLLEGAPAFEGVTDEERWIARQLDDAGAEILFMVNDSESDVHDRYDNQHAKIIVVDGTIALIGSENLNNTSFAADDKSNGTAGRRGVYLITDAPGVVARLQAILDADADPANHLDVVGCDQAPDLCSPAGGLEPALTPDWITYTVHFTAPLITQGTFAFEVIQSPENSLRDLDSLLGLLGRAGPGDTLLIEQFYE